MPEQVVPVEMSGEPGDDGAVEPIEIVGEPAPNGDA
jgi:hypothetical protein